MSLTILITRPEPDASHFEQMLQRSNDLDCRIVKYPLTEIIFASNVFSKIRVNINSINSINSAQFVVATSANALRAALPPEIFALPIFTVGTATAHEARRAGFDRIIAAQNDLTSLSRAIIAQCDAQAGGLLYLTGRHRAGNLTACLARRGFNVRAIELYEARAAKEFSPMIIQAFRSGAINVVSFFSPRSAEIFAQLARRHNLCESLGAMRAACLARSSAAPLAGLGFGDLRMASDRTIEAMCALIASC